MSEALFIRLAKKVAQWRKDGYICDEYPLIGEILAYQKEEGQDNSVPKFLRKPQLRALEVYWYVRLVLKTPHIIDIYKRCYGNNKREFFNALGVSISDDAIEDVEIDKILEKIKNNEEFVRRKRIEVLHEALTLAYPSYILALAMGAGKTVLIGAIIATEFAMSLRYCDSKEGKLKFMKNALVFAPGTTIIESLRELSEMPFDKILPPALNRDFHANLKIEFPTGKSKDIQTQEESSYNLIVTNTEKISLRANRRKGQNIEAFKRDEVYANLRLLTIASLPNLGIFSDEAHHTYGNIFEKLKRVRETINYIDETSPIVAAVNTTGTPYYKRQPLKEVIIWYGLGEGIRDNILKDLNNGIYQYDIGNQSEAEVFNDIIKTFFDAYGNVSLLNGAKAKIAFYFKTQEHLESSRQLIEHALASINQSPTQILVNTQQSSSAEIDEFKRLNNPDTQKRIILLIGKGVEGWNCPSLFACALIKEQTSNNYVLQASTRCLRQTPGNSHSAKIFLDSKNEIILDRELQDNFGTDLDRLSAGSGEKEPIVLRILKYDLPKLEINYTTKRAVRKDSKQVKVSLKKPKVKETPKILLDILTPDFSGPREILMPTGGSREIPLSDKTTDCYTAAWKIATRYHLSVMPILEKIKALYPQGEVPNSHLYDLFSQVEKQQTNYKIIEEQVSEVMALIKIKNEQGEDIFDKDDEEGIYIHHLRVLKRTLERMQEDGLLADNNKYGDNHDLSFHYTPYNFDSKPERSLFQKVLSILNTNPNEIEAFLFTGGLTDPQKTDFHFEYKGEDKRYHRYFPDFVIVKKTGEFYIVEVKSERERNNSTVQAKTKAVEKLENMQPDKFRYQVIYKDRIGVEETNPIRQWIENQNTD